MFMAHFDPSVSSDVLQERLDAVIKTVLGFTGIADDILAKGHSKMNHYMAVLSLLEATQNSNLKFNPDKIQFKTKIASFLGSFPPQMV